MSDAVYIIAGATGTLGRAITERLLQMDRSVLALGRDPGRLGSLGDHPRLETAVHDLRGDPAPVTKIVGARHVDAVVHTAGDSLRGSILDVAPESIRNAVEVKVTGLLLIVRAVRERLRAGSRIIAIGGNLGFDPTPAAATPGLGNAAQAAAIRQLNRALAPDGVTCHTVAPGPVASPRFDALVAAEAARRGVDTDTARQALLSDSPLGRATTIAEVTWAVSMLLEPEAAALAGGTLLLDTGRRTALP